MRRLTKHDEDIISFEVALDDLANLMMHTRIAEVSLKKTGEEEVNYTYIIEKERSTLQ